MMEEDESPTIGFLPLSLPLSTLFLFLSLSLSLSLYFQEMSFGRKMEEKRSCSCLFNWLPYVAKMLI